MDILIVLLIGVLIFGIVSILLVIKFDRTMSIKDPINIEYNKAMKEKKDK